MTRLLLPLVLAVSAACWLPGQSAAAPEFEVASIKPSLPDGPHGVWTNGSVSRIQMLGLNLKSLITFAYDVQGYQVFGPKGLDAEMYDVIAKLPPETEKLTGDAWWSQVRAMSQTMLAERFKVAIHRESRELSVYMLIAAKNGIKLRELGPNPGDNVVVNKRPGHLSTASMPMSQLVSILRGQVGRPVLDQTCIRGVFDIALDWAPEMGQTQPVADGSGPANNGPSLFTAVQEQLGLKLDAGKSPFEVLVVDRVEKPSEN